MRLNLMKASESNIQKERILREYIEETTTSMIAIYHL